MKIWLPLSLAPGSKPKRLPPLSWDDYRDTIEKFAADGYAGAVLIVRNGVVILNRGFGFSDDAKKIRNTDKTLFAIGSVPIDFTKAAILLLMDRGQLKLTDRVSKYLDGVPADKAATTISHLMTGRSGLKNFHGIRGVDEDLDLSYIDRDLEPAILVS